MAEHARAIRQKMRQISMKLLEQIIAQIDSDIPWSPKDLRELTISAEKCGAVAANAFQGVRDLLDEGTSGGQLDSQIAIRLMAAMANEAISWEDRANGQLPAPVQGDIIQVTG
jgi:hypothetical protein